MVSDNLWKKLCKNFCTYKACCWKPKPHQLMREKIIPKVYPKKKKILICAEINKKIVVRLSPRYIWEKTEEETKLYLSLKQVATAVSMAPCDFCDPKTYFSVQKFQHCFKVQTRNKKTKKYLVGSQLMSIERWSFIDSRFMGMGKV